MIVVLSLRERRAFPLAEREDYVVLFSLRERENNPLAPREEYTGRACVFTLCWTVIPCPCRSGHNDD